MYCESKEKVRIIVVQNITMKKIFVLIQSDAYYVHTLVVAKDAINLLENFSSKYGASFYNLPINSSKIKLVK